MKVCHVVSLLWRQGSRKLFVDLTEKGPKINVTQAAMAEAAQNSMENALGEFRYVYRMGPAEQGREATRDRPSGGQYRSEYSWAAQL